MIDINDLIILQDKLDKRIIDENGKEEGITIFKILALLTEVGESLNEWRHFKYWSKDRSVREGSLVVELSDCLHLILSLGISEGVTTISPTRLRIGITDAFSIERHFIMMYRTILDYVYNKTENTFYSMFSQFLMLVESLGVDKQTLIESYVLKNKENHMRQDEGY